MDLPVKELIFDSDTSQRKQWFRAASFSHPAKMVLGLQIYLIEHYTKPGETILDPMAGSGTILVGCALGRNVVCVELEKKFVKMMQANWEKIRSLRPLLGYKMGQTTILQGDSRNLDNLLVDKIVTSPPYAEALDGAGISKHNHKTCNCTFCRKNRGVGAKVYQPTEAGQSNGQISSLPYGEISAVISSPPYEGTISGQGGRQLGKPTQKDIELGMDKRDMPYADAVITSPPYAIPATGTGDSQERFEKRLKAIKESGSKWHRPKPTGVFAVKDYGKSNGQIGNLKSENYLEAMLAVYRQCHRVLKEKGLMVLVVKNFIRDKKIVRLDLDTIKLCEKTGFVLKERLKRKLLHQSFWRIIYQKKFPDAPKIEFEDVLIFEKGK